MRLKYLTLCLLGLGLSACSQHVIKTNSGSKNLEQKAINSLNAMYEYPSYDYRGKFNVHIEPNQNKSAARQQSAPLDAALKQKVEQYLKDHPQEQALIQEQLAQRSRGGVKIFILILIVFIILAWLMMK